MIWMKWAALGILILNAAACASLRSQPIDSGTRECFELMALADQLVSEAGRQDGGPTRIDEFPYLRIDRFHAALVDEAQQSPAAFRQWSKALRQLDSEARGFELANLPEAVKQRHPKLPERVESCANTVMSVQMENGVARRNLIAAARVPDDYNTWQRWLGMYPVAIPFLNRGVNAWHEDARALFATPAAELPVQGELLTYRPQIRKISVSKSGEQIDYASAYQNPLRIPQPEPELLRRLLQQHAPIIEQNVLSDSDRIGMPEHGLSGPDVNIESPVVLTDTAITRFQGKNLLQLLYVFWYPERPSQGLLDILAGDIDSLYWRVTLDENGQPLLYDTIHACGCYHYFFPTQDWPKPANDSWFKEPVLAPHQVSAHGRKVLRVEAISHYLQGVRDVDERAAGAVGKEYRLLPYDLLRQLTDADGQSRSWFDQSSLLLGSERPERWLLWPTGVPSAGAMRQWGHHATAFVGRRHFDDANLIEQIFFPENSDNFADCETGSDKIPRHQHRRR